MEVTGINAIILILCSILGIVWVAHDIYVVYDLFTNHMELLDFIWRFFLVNMIYVALEVFLLCIAVALSSVEVSDF